MKNTDGVLQAIRCFIVDYEKHKIHTPQSPLFRGESKNTTI